MSRRGDVVHRKNALDMTTDSTSAAAASRLIWSELGPRDRLCVMGTDACRFIENFTTNKVSDLKLGEGCASFFCDARGWVLDLALIRRVEDGLIIDVEAGQAAPLLTHLDRYHIRERIELRDGSRQESGVLLLGPAAASWLQQKFDQPLPEVPLQFRSGVLQGGEGLAKPLAARLTCFDWFGPAGVLLESAVAECGLLTAGLAAKATPLSAEARTARRLLRGWPLANDIPAKTLPQELGLTDQAICFTKGCYLGQETVARLDALGHVNRRLTVLAVDGETTIAAGAVIANAGKSIATVSSAARRESPPGWLAMAIVPLHAIQQSEALTVAGQPARPLCIK
jgi:folate-binding protein YgfZ